MRIGTFYRSCLLDYLGINKGGGNRVLDVGCHDGYFLSNYQAGLKVGLDLAPAQNYGLRMIAADALFLPFKIKFDKIFAFDVIEHVPDDKIFLVSLINALAGGGELILTTPSQNFKVFPGFLIPWLSKKWGHVRIGYSPEYFEKIISKDTADLKIEWQYWNAPFWRSLYFPLRFLWPGAVTLIKKLVVIVARLDCKFPRGDKGYLLVRIKKVRG